ncbi:AAC_HP2_G0056130.mRNA.1.CDS.1 [Saccharomyces cerevisiae]|jgi:AP-1-like factor|nr:AAC_HP2_G0056130.mRNA.1.CDS.1 [Saccharomyces cerevisiae]CAI6831891.1 AAC_HP2_G0056130.mRNA.1.CDS.1 [Saccharomyces cerevisiae]
MSEIHTFGDFNGELDSTFLEFSGTEIKEPNNFITENTNAIETAAASMVIRQGFHPRQYYTVDAFGGDVLLSAMDIWSFMKVHPKVNTFDLEILGTELKKSATCSNFDILISLKHFIKVFSSKL